YAIITMLIVIALYDQILFRPLAAWAEKFKTEQTSGEDLPESWLLNLFQRTRLFQHWVVAAGILGNSFINLRWLRRRAYQPAQAPARLRVRYAFLMLWYIILGITIIFSLRSIAYFIFSQISWPEVQHVIFLGFVTGLRVLLFIML